MFEVRQMESGRYYLEWVDRRKDRSERGIWVEICLMVMEDESGFWRALVCKD